MRGGASMGGWFLSQRDSTIVARHEVPGKRPRENRPVGYGMIGRSIPDIPEVFLVEDVRRVSRSFVTPTLDRCARLRESDRTLRDGSFGWR
jgi:hypothetical protein